MQSFKQWFSVKNVIGLLSLIVGIQLAIGSGQIKLTDKMFPPAWLPAIQDWSAMLAIIGTMIVSFLTRSLPDADQSPPAPAPKVAPGVAGAAVLALAIGLTLLFGAGDAFAEGPIARTLQDAARRNDVNNPAANPAGSTQSRLSASSCGFDVFAKLDPKTVVDQIRACVASDVNGVVSIFADDVKGALDSAVASNDAVGKSCLTPGYAIVQAAAGTPGSPAVPTSGATPEVAAVPAKIPGLVTVFQKYREFVLAGGPTACQSWVKTTIAGSLVMP